MSRPVSILVCVFSILAATAAIADENGQYTLDQGFIKFNAPPAWPVIMEKTEGNPQFVAFQVKDPADVGSGESTRVVVETKLLDSSGNFQSMVNRDVEKAKHMPGYERRKEGVPKTALRYFARNGKARYEYRETWYLNGHLLVHVRCERPMLPKTTAAWTQAYNAGCDEIMRSLKPHK